MKTEEKDNIRCFKNEIKTSEFIKYKTIISYFIVLFVGIYISPYIKGFIGLLKTAKQEAYKPEQPPPNTNPNRNIGSETKDCPTFSPVQIYIKKT